MPAISVIIPAYNAERTILETVESVLQQSFSDFELIVVDDGSRDRTLELLSSIRDKRLKVLSYKNGGVSLARNRGIANATGEFIAFLDHDDLWTADKLELQLAALQKHPDAGVAYSWTCSMDEQGEAFHTNEPIFFEGNVYDKLLVSNFLAHGSNPLVRKPAIEAVGGFDPAFCCSDWDFYLRLAARWSFVVVPKIQILYRQAAPGQSSNMSSNIEKVEQHSLLLLEREYQAAPPELQPLKKQSLAVIYDYVAGMHLAQLNNTRAIEQAGHKLLMAVRAYPKILLTRPTQRRLLKWLLLQLPSPKLARDLVHRISMKRTIDDPRLRVNFTLSRLSE